MVRGVSGIGSFSPFHRYDGRMESLRQLLNLNDRIEFRYRSSRLTGRVVDLYSRAVIVSFNLGGHEVTRPVGYGSIIKVLNR